VNDVRQESESPRASRRASRRGVVETQWRQFGAGVAATVAIVVIVGMLPAEIGGGGGQSHVAAALGTLTSDQGTGPAVTVAPTTTQAPSTTTTPPTTTTTTTPLAVPGLGLPHQPTPTPVALTPTNLAPVYSRIPTTNKVIFLGIDDGLVRDPQVLELLRQANIPVTNFLVQGQAQAGEDFWKQTQLIGGIVEAHTINHPDLTKVSAGQLQSEVCGTLDDFQTRFGRRPTLFRPPYGSYNDNVRAVAASCGFKAIVMWKGSTNDGRFDLQDGTQLTPGDIVLLHWRTDLYADLQKVFDTCRQQGFAIASLEDYLR
jgi:peptidoglycan/xylan/chitin deacetylase (PgdA/CDA1 family)